jgi:hypothetical protein
LGDDFFDFFSAWAIRTNSERMQKTFRVFAFPNKFFLAVLAKKTLLLHCGNKF